jgi:nucleoside 2-deoxyribosyltransferase
MKVYFAASIQGDRKKADVFRHIVKTLKDLGHEVLTEHIALENPKKFEIKMGHTPKYIYERDINKWLRECDVVIAEVSGPSFGVGFECASLLFTTDKKLYMLYDKAMENRISALALGCTHPRCRLVPYENEEDITRFLSSI